MHPERLGLGALGEERSTLQTTFAKIRHEDLNLMGMLPEPSAETAAVRSDLSDALERAQITEKPRTGSA